MDRKDVAERVATDGTVERAAFVGSGAERIFAVFHLPREVRGALVICPPLFNDFYRLDRPSVEFARLAAGLGIATASFHYRCTGQSDGASDDLDYHEMLEDARLVRELLADHAQAERVAMLGSRLSAHIAAAASPGAGPLILVEPVLDVNAFLREAVRAQLASETSAASSTERETAGDLKSRLATTGSVEILGTIVPQTLLDAFASETLLDRIGGEPRSIALVSPGPASTALSGFATDLAGGGHRVEVLAGDARLTWWFMDDNHRPSGPFSPAVLDWVRSSLVAA